MNPNQIVDQAKSKMQAALSHFQEELKKLRTGRANPAMLDGIIVQAYGTPMPLIQVGSITVPESQLLQITPFDPSNLQAIANAIRDNQSLGLNPTDDGRVIRVPVPQLTTERREQLAKNIGEKMEEAMISMRNARHDAIRVADDVKKDKSITEDDLSSIKRQLDDLIAKQKAEAERLSKTKEQELMTV